jgi:transmembrane sensor
MTTAPPIDPEVADAMLEAAMMWRQRMEAPEWSVNQEAELEAWLQADERHVRAFERTGQVWDFFDQHGAAPELIAARLALLGRVQRQAKGRWNSQRPSLPTRRLAAAAMIAAAVLGAGVWPLATQGDVYQTGRGERRVVTLRDGSVLSLDALTKVSVRYSDNARRLTLQRGQARFDVSHDPSRPFSVTARDRTVVATGTAFNIDMLRPEVRVTLIEGRVLILPHATAAIPLIERPSRPAKPVELHAGEALVAGRDATAQVVANADLDQATAWQKGKLMFDREPLGEAVERVNRYSSRRIVVADAKAAAVPISGVFNIGDVNAFLEAVNGFLPVTVTDGPHGVTLRSAQPAG